MGLETQIFEDDEGHVFRMQFVDKDGDIVDISNASVIEIKFVPPTGATKVRTAVFTTNGADGQIEYESVAGDLTPVGNWKRQGYVETPSFKMHGSFIEFAVFPHA